MNSKAKILILSNMYPSDKNVYYGIFVKNNYLGISKDFDTHIIYITYHNYYFLKLFNYFLFFIKSYFALFKYYDLVYIHFPSRSFFPLLLHPFRKKIRFVLNFHGSDLINDKLINKFIIDFLKPFFKNSLLIIVPSNYYKNLYVKNFPNCNIFVSPSSGVPDYFYDYKNKNNNYKNYLVYVSSITSEKGIFDLCESAILLKNHGLIFQLHIYGEGSKSNIKKLMNYINQLNGYLFYYGAIHREELPKILSNYKILIFPTVKINESLGLIGIEALSCNLPVIGSDNLALQSYLTDNYNSLIFKQGDINDLFNKILLLLNDPSIYHKIKQNTRYSVLKYKESIVFSNLNTKIRELV